MRPHDAAINVKSSNTSDDGMALSQEKPWVLAHLSDLHLARTAGLRLHDLHGKRLLGWLRWQLKRRFRQNEGLLTTLACELQQNSPDHIAITGDLCHLSLVAEFGAARDWLASLGDPARCSLVFGNHDQYVATDWAHSCGLLLPWLQGDAHHAPENRPAQLDTLFPLLQRRGSVALISLNSARPTTLHLASGKIGREQLDRLQQVLIELKGQQLFRILLLHHPPTQDTGVFSRRRGLDDGPELRALLAEHGVELILSGHTHRSASGVLPGPHGPIPLFGAPSITSVESDEHKRSSYYLFTICPAQDGSTGWTIAVRHRLLAANAQAFIDGPQQCWFSPATPAKPPAKTACAGEIEQQGQ